MSMTLQSSIKDKILVALEEASDESTGLKKVLDKMIERLRKKYRLSLKNDMPPRDKKLLKTLSLDESRSPEFNLFYDLEEYSEEEVAKTMAETMKQYMSKTRADYGSGIARPKIDDKDRASISVMPISTYLNLGLGELAHTKLIVEFVDKTVKYLKGIVENVLVGIGKFVFSVDFIILDMPEDVKVPLILERPFLSTAHAKIDVFKRKITLRVGDEKLIFKSVKPASSLIKRIYMLSLRERMKLDLEARLMGKTLVLNRSLNPLYGDYIELNDLNIPLELRRDQVDDLMPTIEEGEVIEEFRARNDARMVSNFFGYPSDYDHDKKIRISCPYNLKFSCMIDFAVLEDMDAYRDEGMGDVIFGEPFLREVGINTRRFEGLITIYNGNEEVTYQMVQSHLRTSLKKIDVLLRSTIGNWIRVLDS
ncbi:putative reverse transcriptase domain-containing protein [Tanacetum coccineum]